MTFITPKCEQIIQHVASCGMLASDVSMQQVSRQATTGLHLGKCKGKIPLKTWMAKTMPPSNCHKACAPGCTYVIHVHVAHVLAQTLTHRTALDHSKQPHTYPTGLQLSDIGSPSDIWLQLPALMASKARTLQPTLTTKQRTDQLEHSPPPCFIKELQTAAM